MVYNYLDIMPNWETGIALSYNFDTVIDESRHKREQRKPLRTRPLRQIRASYLCKTFQDRMKLESFVVDVQGESFNVPIYSEPIHPVSQGDLFGSSFITVYGDDITDLYNLWNMSYIPNSSSIFNAIILDEANDITPSLLNIQSISLVVPPTDPVTWRMNLQNNVAYHYIGQTTTIYPTMEAFISSVSERDYTDEVRELDLEFTEYLTGLQD